MKPRYFLLSLPFLRAAIPNALAVFLAGIFSVPLLAAEVPLQQARELLKQGDAVAALKLLAPYEEEHAGQANFDYLFGIAAMEAHQPDIAVFALERAAAMESQSAYIHADLARAYAELGERDNAKTELERAQQLTQEPQTSVVIQRYLDALGRNETQPRLLSAFIELTGGYDSNVNNATSDGQIGIPAFGGYNFTLNRNSLELGSNFLQAGGGVTLNYPFTDTTSAFAKLAATRRGYAQHDEYNTGTLEISAGASHRIGAQTFALGVLVHDFRLNNKVYRYTRGVNGQWQWQLTPRTQVGTFLQAGKLVYPGTPIRNVNRYVGGVTVGHILDIAKNPLLYASLYAGNEVPYRVGASTLGHHLQGLRTGGELAFNERWSAFSSLGYERRSYGGTDSLFLVGREDDQYSFNAGLSYAAYEGLSLSPQFSYTKNDSNIPINQFDRMEIMLNVRKDF